MYFLKTQASFDSAHFLAGYEGKCANIHGHRWVAEVEIGAEALQENGAKRGMLIDFGDLKKEVRALADTFDHTLIYEKGSLKPATLAALTEEGFSLTEIDCRPTAENLARLFYRKLAEKGLPVVRTTIYETPDNCAVFQP